MTEQELIKNKVEKLKQVLKKDFENLYVREFTTDWRNQRIIRDGEIDVIDLENTLKFIDDCMAQAYRLGLKDKSLELAPKIEKLLEGKK